MPVPSTNFLKAIEIVLAYEGGETVTENPNDPGGLTKWGISKKSHPNIDIRHLTKAGAMAIYYEEYWSKINAETLPYPVALCAFDTSVNCGTAFALGCLKVTAGLPDYVRALKIIELRQQHYNNLLRKNLKLLVFVNGWTARLFSLLMKLLKEK